MEAQPPPTPPPLSSILPPPPPLPHLTHQDSMDSSPRSRNTDSWDEPYPPPPPSTAATKLRLMISFGGQIAPRPHDKSLCYLGGDTRIIVVERHTSLSDLSTRLSRTFLNNRPFILKYQLPSEDHDSLISVTTDEDLENMIDEYDRTSNANNNINSSSSSSSNSKPSRIRVFLFPIKPDSAQPIGPDGSALGSGKSDEWFLNALNGTAGMSDGGLSESTSVDCLLGLDEVVGGGAGNNSNGKSNVVPDNGDAAAAAQNVNGNGKNLKQQQQGQDVHSVPDSPMMETNSSFGSASSALVVNLPPIRVHAEDGGGGVRVQEQKVMGIEEQLGQLGVGQKQDEGFVILSSPPPPVAVSVPISSAAAVVAGEYPNRVVSDDERSDHGVSVGNRKSAPTSQPQNQTQTQTQVQAIPSQFQQKQSGVVDLPSPDSVSSDSSFANAMSRPKPVIYPDQVQIESVTVDQKHNLTDPQGGIHLQQLVLDPGYVLQQQQFDQYQQFGQQQHQQFVQQQHQQLVADPVYVSKQQFDQQQQFNQQQQQQFNQQQQHQFNQQQQQQFNQQQQQQQVQQKPQFVHGTHFIQQTPAGPVAYYPVYPSQQQHIPQHHHQLDQQYQLYYVHLGQAQAYNLPLQQQAESAATTITASRPQNLPNLAPIGPPSAASYSNPIRNAPLPKPEVAYRTAPAGNHQLVQVPNSQHQQQYVACSQIHHPSQSMAPNSGAPANYAYEFADPAHAQIFYTQHLAPTQYQTMAPAAAQLPPDTTNQQVRTSQQL